MSPFTVVTRPIENGSLRLISDSVFKPVVLAAAFEELDDVRRWLRSAGFAGVYVLSGADGRGPWIRIGEGGKLYARLLDHRADPILRSADRIYVLASPSFTKSCVIHLQACLTDHALSARRARLIMGVGPFRGFPLPEHTRSSLELALTVGLEMLADAGCHAFQPRDPAAAAVALAKAS
jgi:hypothetical protein